MKRASALLAVALAASLACKPTDAQNAAEARAAKETYIDGLHLLDVATEEPRLKALGISLGYTETDTRPGGGRYFCGGMPEGASRSAAAIVAGALARLPDVSFRKLHLRYVILCSEARAGEQRIGGIPVPPLDLLMLNVGAAGIDPAGLQHLALHELFHLVEYRDGSHRDADWDTRFGAGYANSYTGRMHQGAVGSGARGFLNSYSETFPQEERAELFASLLLDGPAVAAHVNAMRDQVLKDKILFLIAKCERLLELHIAFPAS